jgi:hypothetical protein
MGLPHVGSGEERKGTRNLLRLIAEVKTKSPIFEPTPAQRPREPYSQFCELTEGLTGAPEAARGSCI